MGFLSRFENKMEDKMEGAADRMSDAPISPVQIAKKAEKQMRRNKMVGAGRQYAPTLYTVLVNPDDDERLFGYYPTLAGETETYLSAKASDEGLTMDGQPLVRFIVDENLKHGKFDVIAELVAAPIIRELRQEEMARYGAVAGQMSRNGGQFSPDPQGYDQGYDQSYDQGYDQGFDQSYDQSYDQGYGQQYGQDEFFDDGFEQSLAQAAGAGAVQGAAGGIAAGYADGRQNAEPAEDYDYAPDAQPSQYADPYAPDPYAPDPYAPDPYAPDPYAPSPYAQPQSDVYQDPYAPLQPAASAIPQTMAFPAAAAAASAHRTSVPTSQMRARLIDHYNHRTYTLAGNRMYVGRATTNNIVVNDANASRMHAEITINHQGNWELCDLKSTNGTFVNGRQIHRAVLQDGDRVTFGTTDFVFAVD